jgi:prophage antirepressor-like protein
MDIVRAFNSNDLHTEITIKGDHENPLFRASDIELVLGMANIRNFTKSFDETEKVLLTVQTAGGPQQITYLTEIGLYTVLGRSDKPIARTFQKWIYAVVREIRLKGSYTLQQQLQQTQEQLEQERKEAEEKEIELREEIKHSKTVPTLYVYNTDIHQNMNAEIEVKIGITECVHKRIKNYKTSNPFGKIIFTQEIESTNLRAMENIVHHFLHSFRLQGEVFRIEMEELTNAFHIIYAIHQLLRTTDKHERQTNVRNIRQYINDTINRTYDLDDIASRSIETQTGPPEPDVDVPVIVPIPSQADGDLVRKFDAFIEECCIVRPDVEVPAKDIVGQFRLHAREAVGTVTKACTDYLKCRFKYDRLSRQPIPASAIEAAAGQVMGYHGVTLKPVEYKMKYSSAFAPHPEEMFVFHSCIFTPSGKTHYQDLWEEYTLWRKTANMTPPTSAEETALKTYLKECPYLLFETVWSAANNTSGQGFYGIRLKRDIPKKLVSSTGCAVIKRDVNGHNIGEYGTIIQAATAEKISPAGMSRAIKNKIVFGKGEHSYTFTKLDPKASK